MPGCTEENTSDDCCIDWTDLNGDFVVDDVEFQVLDGCEITCDADSSQCINPGSATASFGDPCVRDEDCPALGWCIQEVDLDGDPETPLRAPTGGYCVRDGCNLRGRECGDSCRNLRSAEDPLWRCIKTCRVAPPAEDPFGPSVDCRPGFRCQPLGGDVTLKEKGSCAIDFGAQRGRDPTTLGGGCTTDAECYSPYGLGACLEEDPRFGVLDTGVWYSEYESTSIWPDGTCVLFGCELPGVDELCPGPGMVCEPNDSGGVCLDACDQPGEGVGVAGGCREGYVCATSASAESSGVCFPDCDLQRDPEAYCETVFGEGLACDGAGLCT